MLVFCREAEDMISYDPFWKTISKKSITTYALINHHGINPDTIQRLRSCKPITTTTIGTLCEVIECTVSDIMEYIPDDAIEQI